MIKSAEEFISLRTSELPNEYMRAAHEDAPVDVWLDVISKFPEMREWVALNKFVPLSILEILALDTNEDVRFAVAMKRRLSPELFELLSRDKSEIVRHRIVWNRKTPVHILKRLVNDPMMFIREDALKRVENL